MKYTIITAALATMTSLVSAQHAIVKSNCDFPVYLQSFPYDGSEAGPFTIIKQGGKYVENYRDTGSTIKMSNRRTLASPLFVGYTNEPGRVYYELSSDQGNPFANYRNKLVPDSPKCQRFNCGPGNDACYSHGHSKVPECDKPVNLTMTLCA